jgi:hypothetical protein
LFFFFNKKNLYDITFAFVRGKEVSVEIDDRGNVNFLKLHFEVLYRNLLSAEV